MKSSKVSTFGKFNALETIKSILSGDTDTIYFISIVTCSTGSDDYNEIGRIFVNEEDIKEAIDYIGTSSEYAPNFGEEIKAYPLTTDVCREDFEGFDFDIEDHLEWLSSISENQCDDYCKVGPLFRKYDYRSLDGCLVVYWSWRTYIGYARKFEGIEFYSGSLDESATIDCDKVFRTNISVIAWPEDLDGIDSNSIIEDIMMMGKWENPGAIERDVIELIESNDND